MGSFVYFLSFPEKGFVKIGKANDVENRVRQLKLLKFLDLSKSHMLYIPTEKMAVTIEKTLHTLLGEYNLQLTGFDGATEMFTFDVLPKVKHLAKTLCGAFGVDFKFSPMRLRENLPEARKAAPNTFNPPKVRMVTETERQRRQEYHIRRLGVLQKLLTNHYNNFTVEPCHIANDDYCHQVILPPIRLKLLESLLDCEKVINGRVVRTRTMGAWFERESDSRVVSVTLSFGIVANLPSCKESGDIQLLLRKFIAKLHTDGRLPKLPHDTYSLINY